MFEFVEEIGSHGCAERLRQRPQVGGASVQSKVPRQKPVRVPARIKFVRLCDAAQSRQRLSTSFSDPNRAALACDMTRDHELFDASVGQIATQSETVADLRWPQGSRRRRQQSKDA